MSTGKKIPLAVAQALADRIVRDLTPYVSRIQVAGSIRRRRPTVGDIEIVVEPITRADMFFKEVSGDPEVELLRHKCGRKIGKVVRGGFRQLKVEDVYTVQGVSLDVFLTHPPSQWGSILAIRTGPAAFSAWCMYRLRGRGLIHVAGHVENWETGELVPTPTEEAFFAAAGVDYLEPWERDR